MACVTIDRYIMGMASEALKEAMRRAKTWPEEAQEDAVMVLSDIEEKMRILSSLSPEDQAKLAALRADIDPKGRLSQADVRPDSGQTAQPSARTSHGQSNRKDNPRLATGLLVREMNCREPYHDGCEGQERCRVGFFPYPKP